MKEINVKGLRERGPKEGTLPSLPWSQEKKTRIMNNIANLKISLEHQVSPFGIYSRFYWIHVVLLSTGIVSTGIVSTVRVGRIVRVIYAG